MLFTFPSRYCFTIGRQGVFSLGRWSCRIHTGFLVPRTTRDTLRRVHTFDYRTITSYGGPSQVSSSNVHLCNSVWSVPQPQHASMLVWANPRSLAATDGITVCFLFLRVLRCFSSPGVPLSTLWIQVEVNAYYSIWVPPFGHPRIKACLRLPEAFRRSPRPSSAPGA